MKSVFEYLDEMYDYTIWSDKLDNLVRRNFPYIKTDRDFYFEYNKDRGDDCLSLVIGVGVGHLLNLSSWQEIIILTQKLSADNWIIGRDTLRKNHLSMLFCQEVVYICQRFINQSKEPALEKSKVDEAIALVKVAGYKVVKVK